MTRDGRKYRTNRDLLDSSAGGADERDRVVSGGGDCDGSDVIAGPRDRGRGRDGVRASDWMIDVVLATVVVADLERLTTTQKRPVHAT